MRILIASLTLMAFLAMPAAQAGPDLLVVKPSNHSVSETLDRLTAALEKKGITIFARVDHAAGAEKVGLELPPTELLIFGNPKMGTPLMQSRRQMAIDLPMKALAWQDEHGKVWLGYVKPKVLRARHGIDDRDALFAKMGKALSNFTDAATQ